MPGCRSRARTPKNHSSASRSLGIAHAALSRGELPKASAREGDKAALPDIAEIGLVVGDAGTVLNRYFP